MNDKKRIMSVIFLLCSFALLSLEVYGPSFAQNASDEIETNGQDSLGRIEKSVDLIRNPDFVSINATSGLPLYWRDTFASCGSIFNCAINTTDGWFSNSSFQLSTRNNTNNTWSWISSQEMAVRPGEEFGIIVHMELNEWAEQSHMLVEGFDNSVGEWYRIQQCPSGINGPIEWKIFDCTVKIPTNTTAMVLTLNAGWSSLPGKVAVTTFDAIHAYRSLDKNT